MRSAQYAVALLSVVLLATTGYAGGAAITPAVDYGNKAPFGNYVSPKGTYQLTDGGGITYKFIKIEVKLEKFDAGKYTDFNPFMLAQAQPPSLWSSSDYLSIPPGTYRVYARLTFEQTMGGMTETKDVFGTSGEITFK